MARRIGAHHDRLGREPDQRDAGLPLDVLAEPRIPALLVGSEILPEDRPGDGGVEREDLRPAAEPLGEEEVGDAIDLRGRAKAAGRQVGRGPAPDQARDDLAPEPTDGGPRADALLANDPSLASGELLPGPDHLGTNRHEESLSLACREHGVSGRNASFI